MDKLIDEKFKNIQIFIYCGGKCASNTLHITLNKYFNTLHNHNANHFYIDYPNVNKKYSIFDVINYNAKIYKDIYIIDSYRTPIERKIASFFNNIHLHFPNYKYMKVSDLIHYFNNKYINYSEEYHPLDEVMNYYGLNPFDHFDFDKKYNIISKDNIHFIKLRFNDINIWDKILSEIFKINIQIISDNLSKNKEYTYVYKKFKNDCYISNNYLNNLLPNDKHFKIYNTEEEQIEYYNKWKKRLLSKK